LPASLGAPGGWSVGLKKTPRCWSWHAKKALRGPRWGLAVLEKAVGLPAGRRSPPAPGGSVFKADQTVGVFPRSLRPAGPQRGPTGPPKTSAGEGRKNQTGRFAGVLGGPSDQSVPTSRRQDGGPGRVLAPWNPRLGAVDVGAGGGPVSRIAFFCGEKKEIRRSARQGVLDFPDAGTGVPRVRPAPHRLERGRHIFYPSHSGRRALGEDCLFEGSGGGTVDTGTDRGDILTSAPPEEQGSAV